MRSRKEYTRALYAAKWKRFSIWTWSQHLSPYHMEVMYVLDCMLAPESTRPFSLFCERSLGFHFCVTSASRWVFHFLSRSHFPILERSTQWLPSCVWSCTCMKSQCNPHQTDRNHPPFKPIATTSLLLFMKTAFQVAINSAMGVSELHALLGDPLFIVFDKDKISLRLPLKFMPKIVPDFQMTQTVNLPVVFFFLWNPILLKLKKHFIPWMFMEIWYLSWLHYILQHFFQALCSVNSVNLTLDFWLH